MSDPYFQFKQFSVRHDKCAMKVGTDGVLLGAWAGPPAQGKILDVGTGCGLIALMLAQRCNLQIHGIEIDLQAAEQARENIARSTWKNQITIHHASFEQFTHSTGYTYHMIITNPPYFVNSLAAPGLKRTNARHQTELRIETLFSGVHQLLHPDGKFYIIYPSDKEKDLMLHGSVHDLYPHDINYIQPAPALPPKRIIVAFGRKKITPNTSYIAIETGTRHNYTKEYKKLTKDYYLAF